MKTDITDEMRRQIEERRDILVWWGMNHARYDDMVKELRDADFEAKLSTTGIDVSGTGDKEKLIKAFRIFRRYGYVPSSRPEAKATYFSTYFAPERYEEGLKSVWFSFASTVCQRVQVGTELREVPVYEVQCGQSMTVTDEDLG